MTKTEILLNKAIIARDKAYAPYSNFHVGACIITNDGNYYAGCNVENASYGLTQCAESSAINNMVLHGERNIAAILVVGNTQHLLSPCGSCRQKILEFANQNTQVHLCADNEIKKTMTLVELLPESFSSNILKQC